MCYFNHFLLSIPNPHSNNLQRNDALIGSQEMPSMRTSNYTRNMQNEFICKNKKTKKLEAMGISLVSVQLRNCAERPVTAWAEELGVPMEGPPVISPMRGFAETLGAILTCAGNEDCLGFVVNIKLVVS